MSLENDIQQKSFRSEYQKALLNIIFTHNCLNNTVNDFFKDYSITRQQYNVMRIIRGQSPKAASIQLIRDRMLDKMSDASRIVERLRVKNLIKREASPEDKRTVDITITEDGIKLLETIELRIEEVESSIRKLSLEEAALLNKLLDKIRD
ncbi:MAG TPA: MarR family transcriptional regulator [Cyclobacteriaceae bacterium]|nr:MarR family transcriptional regulator [Cyclobacteriaceae bacterium]